MELNKYIEHTLLKQDAVKDELVKLLDEAKEYKFLGVCVNPVNVALAKKALEGSDVLVCTVVGFPLGANTKEIKALETLDAIKNGADEIDMVINIGKAKEHDFEYIEDEIKCVVTASAGKTTKVIIETCYLSDEEKIECCKAAKSAGATFVKTSTGFGTGGATASDIKLMRTTVGAEMGVKASGGVRSFDDVKVMVDNGATRIGASSGIQIMKDASNVGE